MATAATRALDDYLDLPYRITLSRTGPDGGWTAHVEELPGCVARGESAEQAARAVRAAMRAWIEVALDEGREIPEPRANGHSGRLLLRMPGTLHAELARRADQEGVSLNQFIVGALSGAVGWMRDAATGGVEQRAGAAGPVAELPPRHTRTVRLALVVNLVVVAVAGLAAIVLLAVAWQGGW